jgi:hypothetical protein
MISNHPGPWQQYHFRSDNKGLSIMELKSKYLHEQYLFEAELFNLQQQQQQNMFMNGGGGGPTPSSGPTPPPSYTTELRLTFNNNLVAVQTDFGADPSLLTTWNAKFPNANFTNININQSTPSSPIITLKGNNVNVGRIADKAFANKTTISTLRDVNANCIIDTAGTESFAQSSIVEVDLGAITTIDSIAFNQCVSLTYVLMPNLTLIGTGVMGSSAFNSCTSLNTVSMDNITRIPDYTFYGCTGLANLGGFPVLNRVGEYSFSRSGLINITSETLTTIDQNAFYRCNGLISIFLENPNSIFVGKNAFEQCSQLDSINAYGDLIFGGNDVFLNVASNGIANFTYNQENVSNYNNLSYLDNTKGWTVNFIY